MREALIADIRRLTIHDGPGTRDTVFVKGCPLRCRWCHNPESISAVPQLLFRQKLCINCRECAAVCPEHVHNFSGESHTLDNQKCAFCGKCAESCLSGALTLCGKGMTSEQVFQIVMRDRAFFQNSGGGVTVSGGEPLLFADFTAELFRQLREARIHTALDSCGAVSFSAFEKVLPYTCLILFDLKGMDSERHRENTGCDNGTILENLKRIGGFDIPVEIRMPVIPGCNDDRVEIQQAGEFLKKIPAVRLIRLLPYHAMAKEKYAMCGMEYTMPDVAPPSATHLQEMADLLHRISGKACTVQ